LKNEDKKVAGQILSIDEEILFEETLRKKKNFCSKDKFCLEF